MDDGKVDATLKDGVLMVTIPVKAGAKSRNIQIKG